MKELMKIDLIKFKESNGIYCGFRINYWIEKNYYGEMWYLYLN